jgi:hypothetical protein
MSRQALPGSTIELTSAPEAFGAGRELKDQSTTNHREPARGTAKIPGVP